MVWAIFSFSKFLKVNILELITDTSEAAREKKMLNGPEMLLNHSPDQR